MIRGYDRQQGPAHGLRNILRAKTAATSPAERCARFGSCSLSVSKMDLVTLRYILYKSHRASINNNGKNRDCYATGTSVRPPRLVDVRNQRIRYLSGVFLMPRDQRPRSRRIRVWKTYGPLALVLVGHVPRQLGNRIPSEEGELEEAVNDGVDP